MQNRQPLRSHLRQHFKSHALRIETLEDRLVLASSAIQLAAEQGVTLDQPLAQAPPLAAIEDQANAIDSAYQLESASIQRGTISGETDSADGDTTAWSAFSHWGRSHELELISRAEVPSATAGGLSSHYGDAISADGRFIAFVSQAPNLIDGYAFAGQRNVFRFDRQTGQVDLVSVSADGTSGGNGDSILPRISADGSLIVFQSSASNLHPLDDNASADIFVRDLSSDTTELVSVNASGTGAGSGFSGEPVISADGSVVAFSSGADNLHALDTDSSRDVFIRHLGTGTTQLISINQAGTGSGNASSEAPSLSDNGEVIAFSSSATDLHPLDSDSASDVFVFHRASDTTDLVSLAANGTVSGNSFSGSPQVSGDGSVVGFISRATDLSALDTDPDRDIYVYDVDQKSNDLVSVNWTGTASGNDDSTGFTIDHDGTVVAFVSSASDLHPLDNNVYSDVFVRQLASQSTTLVSTNSDNTGSGNFSTGDPQLSADGSLLLFRSSASNLHPLDDDFSSDVFLYDLAAATTELVSLNSAGINSGNSGSALPLISADGTVAAFRSDATDLVMNDHNGYADMFVTELASKDIELISAIAPTMPSATAGGQSTAASHAVSADGRYVVFLSDATNLAPGFDYEIGVENVFRYDRYTGSVVLVSINATGTGGANQSSREPTISADGNVVAFTSWATNLHPLDTDSAQDIFAHDFSKGTTHLVSVNADGLGSGNDSAWAPKISGDGSVVVFESSATDLHPLDNQPSHDIFARHLPSGTTDLVSVNLAGTSGGDGYSSQATLSADGMLVAFSSDATDLHPLDTDYGSDVFVRNRTNGTTQLASINSAGTGSGDRTSSHGMISADGTAVAFRSTARNLHPLDNDWTMDVFVRQLVDNTTALVTVNPAGTDSAGHPQVSAPSISADGKVVAFVSRSVNLHPLDGDASMDVFVRSLTSGSTQLASVNAAGTHSGDGNSYAPMLAADGSAVVFASRAGDLHPDDGDDLYDIFVHSLTSGDTEIIDVNSDGGEEGDYDYVPAISGDGQVITFTSHVSDLIGGDYNQYPDVFAVDFSEPSCDLDGDDLCGITDIDALIEAIAIGDYRAALDVTRDGVMDLGDRDAWLSLAGARNLASGNSYLLGDANLDGSVDGQDFVAWNMAKFTSGRRWSGGDFNADGNTDGQDFLIWNLNKFETADEDRPRHTGPGDLVDFALDDQDFAATGAIPRASTALSRGPNRTNWSR